MCKTWDFYKHFSRDFNSLVSWGKLRLFVELQPTVPRTVDPIGFFLHISSHNYPLFSHYLLIPRQGRPNVWPVLPSFPHCPECSTRETSLSPLQPINYEVSLEFQNTHCNPHPSQPPLTSPPLPPTSTPLLPGYSTRLKIYQTHLRRQWVVQSSSPISRLDTRLVTRKRVTEGID